jgi:hypothetical protein
MMMDLWRGRFDQYEEEWLLRYAYLRAVEWLGLPLFAAQPIVPMLLLFFPVWPVLVGLLLLCWPWAFVRYRLLGIRPKRGESKLISVELRNSALGSQTLIRIADAVQWFVHLKWPAAIAAGIYLYYGGQVLQAATATLWPLITLLLIPFSGSGGLVGAVQKRFLLALGFVPVTGDPANCRINDFHRPGCAHLRESPKREGENEDDRE